MEYELGLMATQQIEQPVVYSDLVNDYAMSEKTPKRAGTSLDARS